MVDYIPARLANSRKRTYIVFYQTNPISKIRERFRISEDLGRLPADQRAAAAAEIIDSINAKLPYGYPFDREYCIAQGVQSTEAALDQVADSTADLRLASVYSYRYGMKKLKTFLDQVGLLMEPVTAINKKVAMAYSDWLTKSGLSARSHNNDLNDARRIFNQLKLREIVLVNPFDGVPKRKVSGKNRTEIKIEDARTILTYAHTHDIAVFMGIAILYYALIRPNEQRFIKVSDIDLDNHVIHIHGKNAKNKKDKPVTIPEQLQSILIAAGIERMDPDLYLIGKTNQLGSITPIAKSGISNRYRKMINLMKEQRLLKSIAGNVFYSWKDTGINSLRKAKIDAFSLKEHARWHSIAQAEDYLSERVEANEFIRMNHRL